ADVRSAQIAELVVFMAGSEGEGATANTLRSRVTVGFCNALAGQTVCVLAVKGAWVAPVVSTQADGSVVLCVTSQTAGWSAVTVC
ncbi:Ig-like domain-containing protein, partial [Escherichia coli]|uniref:Ig-like domain-containing protein n=1 Tax=Escherichia coli TaxID=562 RepID=UPI0021199A1E